MRPFYRLDLLAKRWGVPALVILAGAGLALLCSIPKLRASCVVTAKVTLGIDVLLTERMDLVQGKRVALLTHPAGVDGQLMPTLDRVFADKRVKLTQLFSPEHGIRGDLPNGETSPVSIEPVTGLPLEGIYGKHKTPTPDAIGRTDVIVFDVQDIGTRSYTYIATMGEMMKAAKAFGLKFIVLDRPNPIGGLKFEGPVRDEKYQSWIGWGPLPITHGMTIGEVAQFYNEEMGIHADLTVVKMKGWKREMRWDETGLTWIPPSTGVPNPQSALGYAITALVGGVTLNVNEGIGTAMPFLLVGAAFANSVTFADTLNQMNKSETEGLHYRPYFYTPRFSAFKEQQLQGTQILFKDQSKVYPVKQALQILTVLQKLYGPLLKVDDAKRFGRMWGNDEVLSFLQKGKSAAEIEATWTAGLKKFEEKRKQYLLY